MSPDVFVMLRPAQAFEGLAENDGHGVWIAVRRPLRMLIVLAAVGSLQISGRISLRLLLACGECAAFLPVLLMASVCVARGRRVSLARAIDLFFMGLGPWILWFLPVAAVWAFVPAEPAYALLQYRWVWYLAGLCAFVWSCVIDFWFLRRVCAKSATQAVRWLAVQRFLVWTAGLAIFLGASGWQVLATRFGW